MHAPGSCHNGQGSLDMLLLIRGELEAVDDNNLNTSACSTFQVSIRTCRSRRRLTSQSKPIFSLALSHNTFKKIPNTNWTSSCHSTPQLCFHFVQSYPDQLAVAGTFTHTPHIPIVGTTHYIPHNMRDLYIFIFYLWPYHADCFLFAGVLGPLIQLAEVESQYQAFIKINSILFCLLMIMH